MKAELLFRDSRVFDDGSLMVIKIWSVPKPVPPATHGLKYSLYYGRLGERLIGYDNERGKGDHRHYGKREEVYRFVSLEKLLDDFLADIEKHRGRKTK